jgi:hypothetical protein
VTRAPHPHAPRRRSPRAEAGSALLEALVALGLIALAGLVVATAAATGLRASARAATIGRTAAVAGRELAALATRAADAVSETRTLAIAGFPAPVTCAAGVTREGGVASLAVRVTGGRPAEVVGLTTRVTVVE